MRATACLRFQKQKPYLFRICTLPGGALHTSRQYYIRQYCRCSTLLRTVLASWESDGLDLILGQAVKFVVHKRVLPAAVCYPPWPARCSMVLRDLRDSRVWLKQDDFFETAPLDQLG